MKQKKLFCAILFFFFFEKNYFEDIYLRIQNAQKEPKNNFISREK